VCLSKVGAEIYRMVALHELSWLPLVRAWATLDLKIHFPAEFDSSKFNCNSGMGNSGPLEPYSDWISITRVD